MYRKDHISKVTPCLSRAASLPLVWALWAWRNLSSLLFPAANSHAESSTFIEHCQVVVDGYVVGDAVPGSEAISAPGKTLA